MIRLLRMLAVTLTAALALMPFFAGTAAAHSTLVSCDPADGSSISVAPARASMTFNEALQPEFPTLNVIGPDKKTLWSHGPVTVEGPTVSVALDGLGPAGVYTIAYRVTSADGHPVSGTRTFTLTEAGHGTSTPLHTEKKSDSGLPAWVTTWGFGGIVVVLAGAVLFIALRRN